jgi:hypothetical protein
MEEAELEGCEVSFLRARAVDRWLLIEVADCCEMERSRGAEEAAVVASMSPCPNVAWSWTALLFRSVRNKCAVVFPRIKASFPSFHLFLA